ncbi:MAG: UvrD-helicase domain-containing protein [Desulfobacterales bacterium]|nr:UvrD-helicase domain-containing protein [Desulfobacterales bacterium]
MKHFDLLNTSLEGTNLIEASAGTGKTYTITGLFLRLVLEKNLSIDEILVVTFTEAATEELKDRIRRKLHEAIQAFQRLNHLTTSMGRNEDPFLNELAKRHRHSKTALRCLRDALLSFDQAAIFTIHGFCRRMLYENAFESGSLFDTELVTDQEDLKGEIVDDFWRRYFYNASPLFIHYAINNKTSPESLLDLIGNEVSRPYLKIIPQFEPPDSSHQEKEFKERFNEICKAWQSSRAEVETIFISDGSLNRNRYREANIPIWLNCMDDYVASDGNDPALFKGFDKFTTSELKRAVKKNHVPPTHPFFELCEKLKEKQEELERIFEQRLLGLKAKLLDYLQNELTRRKGEKNIQSFDDLLLKLYWALEEKHEKGGEALATAIRRKFKAALIDEFQDTDPVQYAIFKKVFGSQNSVLFLIGDPKQAIYGFRGADIFAYMDAARHVESRYTLKENWRSEPGLITAINSIFANANHPFVYEGIPFQPAARPTLPGSPGPDRDYGFGKLIQARRARASLHFIYPELLRIHGEAKPPFQFWVLDASKVTKSERVITKTLARELILGAVAVEISRLLGLGRNNKALLGKRPLKEGDVAVLVRTNAEARLIQEALSRFHIPSVLHSTGNLFDSHEALEMERVLAGISEPNHERLLKAALTTDMIGLRGEDLDALMEDETGWEALLVKFRAYQNLWNKHGFIRMFRYLLSEENVRSRLMSLPDGERRNTNLLHLSEVLHQASIEEKLGMTGVLKWLSEQRAPNTKRSEEHELRLEKDENAVKVVTIHKSKGLEYPVVFCPFAWSGSRFRRSKEPFTFHDEDDNMRLTLDLGSADMDENRVFAEKEQLAENLRLLYVALTRAKNRCYFVWGRFKEAETSAPAYLLHQPGSWEGKSIVSATGERFSALTDKDLFEELRTLERKANGTINLVEMRTIAPGEYFPLNDSTTQPLNDPTTLPLTCREFSGDIDRSWRISSFSSLISGQPRGAELADRDAISLPDSYNQMALEESTLEEEPSGIFAFPGGTKAGTFLHDILEHLDFAQKDTSPMEKLVTEKLDVYGFEPTWQETICRMIQKVLSVPLEPSRKDFTFSRIRNADRLNELEFYFPLQSISPKKLAGLLRSCFSSHFPEHIERLHFAPVRGFMKGFIDMVFQFEGRFYLVDWKSNFLGGRVGDYGQEALAAVMEKEFYVLQYYIYTLALDQYLRLRLAGYNYETHFGGVYYIFLRGVDPERGPDFGIYRNLPSPELVKALREDLIEKRDGPVWA